MGTFSMLLRILLGAFVPIFSFVLIFFQSFAHLYWTESNGGGGRGGGYEDSITQ